MFTEQLGYLIVQSAEQSQYLIIHNSLYILQYKSAISGEKWTNYYYKIRGGKIKII